MSAEDVVLMLNQYFSVMVDIVFKNNGLRDKFVGDQLIAGLRVGGCVRQCSGERYSHRP